MDLVFERGSQNQPRGHALLFFRNSADTEELWATYLVVLPITVDVSKYVPPFLMNQIGEFGPKDLSAFAFPPFPEQIRDYDYLTELANIRDDDIVFGGSIDPSDVVSAMTVVNDVVENYTQAYSDLAPVAQPAEALPSHEAEGLSINEVMYGLMSDGDKLGELTKLVGRLRFAVEGGEEAMAREAESDIIVLSKLLPENHQIPRLVEAAKSSGSGNAKLANLYLQRCFHILQEEYVRLGELDAEIRALEAEEGQP